MSLSDKQKYFVKEYLVSLNATKAWQKVYKSSYEVACVNGPRAMKNEKIKELIKKDLIPIFDDLEISKERILREYASIAFSDIYEFIERSGENISLIEKDQLPQELRGAVKKIKINTRYTQEGESEVTVDFELHDKIRALDTLAKYVKLIGEDEKAEKNDVNITLSYDPKKLKDS